MEGEASAECGGGLSCSPSGRRAPAEPTAWALPSSTRRTAGASAGLGVLGTLTGTGCQLGHGASSQGAATRGAGTAARTHDSDDHKELPPDRSHRVGRGTRSTSWTRRDDPVTCAGKRLEVTPSRDPCFLCFSGFAGCSQERANKRGWGSDTPPHHSLCPA